MKSLCSPVVVALLAAHLVASPPSQGGSARCSQSCVIEFSPVVTLRGRSAAEVALLPLHTMNVSATSSGGYVLPSRLRDSVLLFDRLGRLTLESKGADENRFQMISNIIVSRDGDILAFDLAKQMLFRLDSELKIKSAHAFRHRPSLLLPPVGYLHAEQIPTADLVGQPLHVIDSSGKVLRSFGADEPTSYRRDQPLLYERVVAQGLRGTIWSAAPGRYVLEQWNPLTGRRLVRVEVGSPWFKPSLAHPPRGERPLPIIVGLWEEPGVVWTLLRDADSKWKPRSPVKGERPVDMDEYDADYDFVLEAVDPTSGRVLAAHRIDRAVSGQSPHFLLAMRSKDQRGQYEIVVRKPTLVKRGA